MVNSHVRLAAKPVQGLSLDRRGSTTLGREAGASWDAPIGFAGPRVPGQRYVTGRYWRGIWSRFPAGGVSRCLEGCLRAHTSWLFKNV